jgi:hypothetical protein
MTNLRLTIAVIDYDHVRDFANGVVVAEGAVEITKWNAHRRRLRNVTSRLKPIYSDIGLMRSHMARIGDQMRPRDFYYDAIGIAFDQRGKVIDLVENIYDRAG